MPQRFYPEGGSPREAWNTLFYSNLIKDFLDELTTDTPVNQGNFEDGAGCRRSSTRSSNPITAAPGWICH